MVITLEKGKAIIGEGFGGQSNFDVLQSQRDMPQPQIVPVASSKPAGGVFDTDTVFDDSSYVPPQAKKENVSEQKWVLPKKFLETISAFIADKENELRKNKLASFLFDVSDETKPDVVMQKIFDALEQGTLTDLQAEQLTGVLRKDAEMNYVSSAVNIQEPELTKVQDEILENIGKNTEQPVSPVVSMEEQGITAPLEEEIPIESIPEALPVVSPVQEKPQETLVEQDKDVHVEKSIEVLEEDLRHTREEYIQELVSYKASLGEQKIKYEKVMSDLGQSGRQMPEIQKSLNHAKAEELYEQARKAYLDRVKQSGGSVQDTLTFVENEERVFEKRLGELVPGKGGEMVKKILATWSKAPLPDRVDVSRTALRDATDVSPFLSGPFGVKGLDTNTNPRKPVDGIIKKTPVPLATPEPLKEEEVPVVESVPVTPETTAIESDHKPAETLETPPSPSGESALVAPVFEGIDPLQVVSGNAPLPEQFQFDPKYKKERQEYLIDMHKKLLELPEGAIDFSLPVEYQGGQIIVFQKGNDISILLNGKKIGSGTVMPGTVQLHFDPLLEKKEYRDAFDYIGGVIKTKSALFKMSV